MSDGDLALSILRKFAEGVHGFPGNWLDPDGTLDGRIEPTPEERDLLQRLNATATAADEAEYAAEQQALLEAYGPCAQCGNPRRRYALTGAILCSVDSAHG